MCNKSYYTKSYNTLALKTKQINMGMDIYNSNDENYLITTNENINSIKKQLLKFKNRTRFTIDEYGKTNLYFEHIVLLNTLISEQNEWNIILKKVIKKNVE